MRTMGAISIRQAFARPVGRISGRCLDMLFDVWSLHRERRALQSFDDRALKDIGLTRADIEQELAKPFWRR
jgi:uncharacterized protein YjiS (DUF1127 family)